MGRTSKSCIMVAVDWKVFVRSITVFCRMGLVFQSVESSQCNIKLGVHDMQQALCKAKPGDYKHAVKE